jgi:hypothetical protein
VSHTPEQITKARRILIDGGTDSINGRVIIGDVELDAIRVLIAATESYEHEATVKKLEIEFAEGRCVEV